MTTKELEQKVSMLQSAIIGLVGRDAEGNYRPAFVKRVLRRAQEPTQYRFTDANSFLKELHRSHG